MPNPYLTYEFVVTQVKDGPGMEIWVDWVPAVDGDPKLPIQARLDGKELIVEPDGPETDERQARRVVGLVSDVLAALPGGLVWRVCGPSGVLAEHHLLVAPKG